MYTHVSVHSCAYMRSLVSSTCMCAAKWVNNVPVARGFKGLYIKMEIKIICKTLLIVFQC